MAVFEFLFHVQSNVFVHRTVVSCDQFSEERAKFLHDGLGHFPRVGKDQGGRVSTDQIGNRFNVVFKHLDHGEVAKFRVRDQDVQVEFP